jgi:hypothetical protein
MQGCGSSSESASDSNYFLVPELESASKGKKIKKIHF